MTVEVFLEAGDYKPGEDTWQPVNGEELNDIIVRQPFDDEEAGEARRSTLRILRRCQRPQWGDARSSAELVVGAVQSGKTFSFTSVIAAARDNGFPLILVLAGTTKNLRSQTYGRLRKDLRMTGRRGATSWHAVDAPNSEQASEALAKLQRWHKFTTGAKPPTVVAVALKNHLSIDHATEFMRKIHQSIGGTMPVLIIDDEADQAGLNTAFPKGEESATYAAIQRLRTASSNHTYLMYTATPQAPLLISLADTLSPDSVTVLTPGKDYLGGADLFGDNQSAFLRTIDVDQENALDPTSEEPPPSLCSAIAFYLLALAVAWRANEPYPLTMLIHPSSTKDLHSTYEEWTQAIIERIRLPLESRDPQAIADIAESFFSVAYDDLSGTIAMGETAPPSLLELLDYVYDYLIYLKVQVVNSDDGNEIQESDWDDNAGWIVIGGNKLNRGFTIKNLAVTYMPRSPGVKNVDTVQQRGRFFGYKRSYKSLLRAWINSSTSDVYSSYVEHEEDMRRRLSEVDEADGSLKDWRRSFLLNPGLKLTRSPVVSLDVDQRDWKSGWVYTQTRLFGEHVGPMSSCRSLLEEVASSAQPDPRDLRLDVEGRNRSTRIALARLLPLLTDWQCGPSDKVKLDSLLVLLQNLGLADAEVVVVDMDGAIGRGVLQGRRRSVRRSPLNAERAMAMQESVPRDQLEITGLYQGPSPASGTVYIGDAGFRDQSVITVQFHTVSPVLLDEVQEPVIALAINLPPGLTKRIVLQLTQGDGEVS